MLACVVKNKRLQPVQKLHPTLRRGWAAVKVRIAGICNTDLEILRGYHDFRGTPGHEFVGQVTKVQGVSKAVEKSWLGKRVVGEINIACSAHGIRPVCRFCKRGLKTHCEHRTVLGIVGHDGAFAEYLSLPLENLHRVPRNVSDEQAVFVEPLAAACQILTQIEAKKFASAAVLGDGKLAQLIARVLQTKIRSVTVYGKHMEKLRLAKAAEITVRKVSSDGNFHRNIRDRYPLAVEATGSPSGLTLAQEMTEPRGTLILKSTFHGAAPVETWPTVVKELSIVGSRCGPFDHALKLLASKRVDPSPLISAEFPLASISEAIRWAQRPGILKVLVRP